MRRVGEFFALLMLLAVQVTLWPELTGRFLPAFSFIAAFSWGLARSVPAGFQLAFISGLLLDLYTQQHFGLFTVATVLGYSPLWFFLRGRPAELSGSLKLALFVMGATVYELTLLVWLTVANAHFPFFAELLKVATLNVVSSLVFFSLMAPLVDRYVRSVYPAERSGLSRSI